MLHQSDNDTSSQTDDDDGGDPLTSQTGKGLLGRAMDCAEDDEHGASIRRGRVDIHRDQAIFERFNRTLAERLFGHQQAQELLMKSGERSREWVKRLPAVVEALDNEVTQLMGKKPADAIRAEVVTSKSSAPARSGRTLCDQVSTAYQLYYLVDGPERGFVREELLVVPPDTELPHHQPHSRGLVLIPSGRTRRLS